MNTHLRILHLEDDPADARLIRSMLQSESLVREITRVETGAEFAAALDQRRFDFILSDHTMPGFDGMSALALAREKQPDVPFIFVSGTIGEELAIESLKQGATDYIFKNRLSRLGPAMRRALRDVEEREESRRAEEAMRQSEHKYRQLFESLSDAAFLADLETGRILDTNKQGERLLGRTRGEIISLNQSRFHSPAKFEEYRRRLAAAAEEKGPVDFEGEVIRKDGAVVPVNVRANILLLYGRPLIISLYCDLTAHKQSEEQIHAQAKLLDLVPDAILVRDLEDRIQHWNQGAVRLYGWTQAEAMGRQSTQLLYQDLAEFDRAKQTVMEAGEWSGELHQVTKEGHEVLVHSRWTLMRSEQGIPRSVLLVNTDITEKMPNRLERRSGDHECAAIRGGALVRR